MSKFETYLRWGLLFGPTWYLGVVAYITLSRFTYRFELEWMEGGSLLHLLRLQAGQPLYVAPGFEFTPYIYPPFYYYSAWALSKLTGLTWFAPLRLTSLLASLGCTSAIFLITYKRSNSIYWGVLSAGVFIAAFRAAGAWFDIARVDMLFTFWMLAGLYALTASRHWSAELISGLLFALAFYTKQTSIVLILVALAALLLLRGWRSTLRLGFAFTFIAVVVTFIENSISNGWYWYYVFHLPRFHQFVEPLAGQLLVQTINLLQPMGLFCAIGLAGSLLLLKTAWKNDTGLLTFACLGLTAIAVFAGLNKGSYANAYLPAFAAFALLGGIGGAALEKSFKQTPQRLTLYLLLALQFALLYFQPNAQIPTRADAEAGEKLVAFLKKTPGDVLIPYHSYLAIMAGKPAYAHHIALLEIRGAFGDQTDSEWITLENEINSRIQDKRFALVVLEHQHELWRAVFDNYQATPIEYPTERTFLPVTGAETRPETLWQP